MKNHNSYIISVFVLSVLALAGCQKESSFLNENHSDAVVRFAPSIATVGDRGQTRSATTKGTLYNETDGRQSLGEYNDNFMVLAWNINGTAEKVIPDDASLGSYVTNGYQKVMKRTGADGTEYWMTVQKQTSGVAGAPTDADDVYLWKENEIKTFYAYANLPADGASYVANTDATGQALTYTVPATAAAQTDILMGFYSGDGKTGEPESEKMTGTASIVFSHPLTAIRFQFDPVDGVSYNSIEFSYISIEGVYSTGTAEMTPTSAVAEDASDRFTWGSFGAPTTVGQDISTQPTAADPSIGEPFLLIPQEFSASSNARIAIGCTIEDNSSVLFYPLSGSTGWKCGMITTYHITYEDGSLVFVESEVNEWNKQNRNIKVIK